MIQSLWVNKMKYVFCKFCEIKTEFHGVLEMDGLHWHCRDCGIEYDGE